MPGCHAEITCSCDDSRIINEVNFAGRGGKSD